VEGIAEKVKILFTNIGVKEYPFQNQYHHQGVGRLHNDRPLAQLFPAPFLTVMSGPKRPFRSISNFIEINIKSIFLKV